MTIANKPKAFIVACKEFFGFKEGQTLMEFKAEVAELHPKDRTELASLLSVQLGVEVSA